MWFSPINSVVVLLALSRSATARPTGRSWSWQDVLAQNLQASRGYDNPARAAAVIEAYSHSWQGYSDIAFGHDEVRPVSKQASDSRNGWGATIADALSTGILMGQTDAVAKQLDFLTTVDFTRPHTTDQISLFETTIRYLAGLLSGYDLLKGPFSHMVTDHTKVDLLLQQAKTLATTLSPAFKTPSKLADNTLVIQNDGSLTAQGSGITGLAVAGTLVLEWTHLGDLLRDDSWGRLARDPEEKYLFNANPASTSPWPGLMGYRISTSDGHYTSNQGSWGASSDSYYEYLIKMYAYNPQRFPQYKDQWIKAADSTMAHLAVKSGGHTFVAAWSGKNIQLNEQHLTCFIGGNFILGGLVLNTQKYTDFGIAMTEACHATYAATVTHVGPETFGFDPKMVPSDQADFFKKNGFYIGDASYNLRPEVVESYYYAYKATGLAKYQDWAWDAFVGINSTCRVDSGFSSIQNVNVAGGGGTSDFQESFWFAEVLKYFYLIFAPGGNSHGVGVDDSSNQAWVFNTEAHPFSVTF